MADLFVDMVVAGVFATGLLGGWLRVLHEATGIPPTNWLLIGRCFVPIPPCVLVQTAIG